ncbi:hypothetical protein Plhal703r1_c04g0021341 [Plasmopara halstedii]
MSSRSCAALHADERKIMGISSVEEVKDVPSDIVVCDGPHFHRTSPKNDSNDTNWRWSNQATKKDCLLCYRHESHDDGSMKKVGLSETKTHPERKKSSPSSILRAPDQGTICIDEGSAQKQDASNDLINVVVYNKEGDLDIIHHVKIENPPSLAKELCSLPLMSKIMLKRSLAANPART